MSLKLIFATKAREKPNQSSKNPFHDATLQWRQVLLPDVSVFRFYSRTIKCFSVSLCLCRESTPSSQPTSSCVAQSPQSAHAFLPPFHAHRPARPCALREPPSPA